MTNSSDEADTPEVSGISDDQLPEDLRPDAGPLAEGLEPGETAGDGGAGELLEEGKPAEEDEGSQKSHESQDPDDPDDSGDSGESGESGESGD